jgi:phosphohistidine phosphatase
MKMLYIIKYREKIMKIYLIQHAKSMKKEDNQDCPLTKEGLDNIRKVARFLDNNIKIHIKNIFYSGKTRTRQTAEILADYLYPTNGIVYKEGLNPLDDISIWVANISNIDEDTIIVGHLPHLKILSSYLLTGEANNDIIDFKNAGVVCMDRDKSGKWIIGWVITPDII